MLYSKTSSLLDELETQLKHANAWSEEPPSEQAMASIAPFACDQMSFDAWLQFIFLPKMRHLIKTHQPLPSSMALLPMAEQVWSSSHERLALMLIIKQLDELFNG